MVYSNPGSWERVSHILWGYENDSELGILKNLDDLTTLFGGLLNQNMTRMFISFIRDRKDISPKDVFYNYEKVRNDILGFVEKSDNIKMGQLIESFVTFLATSQPKYTDKELENISKFLTDVPSDIGVLFITKLSVFDIKSEEFRYVTKIHGLLVEKFPDYKTKFYESMVRTNRKVNAS